MNMDASVSILGYDLYLSIVGNPSDWRSRSPWPARQLVLLVMATTDDLEVEVPQIERLFELDSFLRIEQYQREIRRR